MSLFSKRKDAGLQEEREKANAVLQRFSWMQIILHILLMKLQIVLAWLQGKLRICPV